MPSSISTYWLYCRVPLNVDIECGTCIYRVAELLTLHGVVAGQCIETEVAILVDGGLEIRE